MINGKCCVCEKRGYVIDWWLSLGSDKGLMFSTIRPIFIPTGASFVCTISHPQYDVLSDIPRSMLTDCEKIAMVLSSL